MLNPCHFVVVSFFKFANIQQLSQAICFLGPYNWFTDRLAMSGMWMNFGAWIGLIFTENDGLNQIETFVYFVEHFMAAFVGTLVMSMSSRFDILQYANRPYLWLGHILFSFYMRPYLTPISHFTWANLNHCLCGTDTDPFYVHLNLGKWYFFIGEFYLGFLGFVFFWLNFVICYLVKRIICQQPNEHLDKKTN